MLWITKLKALSFHSLGVTHLFLGEYPLSENSISLWQSCSENFREICRKGSVTEIIVSISCKLWKFLRQLFQRTPSNRCFHFSDFSVKHAEHGWGLAVKTKWFWMFDGKTVAETDLYSIISGWMQKCLNSECFCIVKATSNMKTHKLEYFCTPSEAVADRCYSKISWEVLNFRCFVL